MIEDLKTDLTQGSHPASLAALTETFCQTKETLSQMKESLAAARESEAELKRLREEDEDARKELESRLRAAQVANQLHGQDSKAGIHSQPYSYRSSFSLVVSRKMKRYTALRAKSKT